MLENFKKYISKNGLFDPDDRLLVAVSGGVDSMVLCHLLHQSDYKFGIAHVNFQLRGTESDADAAFVKAYAAKIGCDYHEKCFDTEGVARAQKTGIQETARNLRYTWFAELAQSLDYQWIVTAHHGSDSIETFLFNFSRGAGLHGLTGISPKLGRVVRPLLFTTKAKIEAFAAYQNIDFVIDQSNATDKYARNFIRHQIVPNFQTLNPVFESTALLNLNRLRDYSILVKTIVEKTKLECVQIIDNQYFISKINLNKQPVPALIFYELVQEFGFNSDQILLAFEQQSDTTKTGNIFQSATHEMTIERDFITIRERDLGKKLAENAENTEGGYFEYFISENDLSEAGNVLKVVKLPNGYGFTFEKTTIFPDLKTETNDTTIFLNLDALKFPLKLRHWQEGDKFQPLGMGGNHQLLSDFFRLKKLSQAEKAAVWLLENGDGEIIWVVGFRISEVVKLVDNCPILKVYWGLN